MHRFSNSLIFNHMADISNIGASVGSGLLGSAWNTIFGGIGAGRQWRYAKRQMSLQDKYLQAQELRQQGYFEKNRDNERSYNDPSAQRARMSSAGINPFASEGTGVSTGSTLDPPSISGSGVSGQSFNGRSFNIDPTQLAQIDVLRSQADLNHANADRARGDTMDPEQTLTHQRLTNDLAAAGVLNANLRNELDKFDLDFRNATRDSNIEKLDQSVFNMKRQAELMNAQLQVEMDKHANNPTVLKEIESRIFVNSMQASLLVVQSDLARKGIEVADTQMMKTLSEITNLGDLNALIKAQTRSERGKVTFNDAHGELELMALSDLRNVGSFARKLSYFFKNISPLAAFTK